MRPRWRRRPWAGPVASEGKTRRVCKVRMTTEALSTGESLQVLGTVSRLRVQVSKQDYVHLSPFPTFSRQVSLGTATSQPLCGPLPLFLVASSPAQHILRPWSPSPPNLQPPPTHQCTVCERAPGHHSCSSGKALPSLSCSACVPSFRRATNLRCQQAPWDSRAPLLLFGKEWCIVNSTVHNYKYCEDWSGG